MKSIEMAKQAAQRINGTQFEGSNLRAFAVNGWLHIEKFVMIAAGRVYTDDISISFSDVGPMKLGVNLSSTCARTMFARAGGEV